MTGQLRQLERLDHGKVERLVKAIDVFRARSDEAKWAIGDLLIAEFPILQGVERAGVGAAVRDGRIEAPVERYLRAVADRVGLTVPVLSTYRQVAGRWPPQERVIGASWTKHRMAQGHPDRTALVLKTHAEIESALGRRVRKSHPRTRTQERSFANISKAAEAAIEVLSDEDTPPEKRVKFALTILVRFFDEVGAA